MNWPMILITLLTAGKTAGGMMGAMQQQPTQSSYQPAFGQTNQQPTQPQQASAQDPTTKLLEMKKLLDAGAITQEEYDKVKAQVLGL